MGTSGSELVMEYVFEGQQRGYNFTSPTNGFADDVLKVIWRQAMPRGQGWGGYIGAQSLKCFPLPDNRVAVSQITVTDQSDESGRRGIRRAVITVLPLTAYAAFLSERKRAHPAGIQQDAVFILENWRRTRLLEHMTRKISRTGQLILAHAFTTNADWLVTEAVMLRLLVSPPRGLRQDGVLPFTTLALSHHDEMALVGMPVNKTQQITDGAVVTVT